MELRTLGATTRQWLQYPAVRRTGYLFGSQITGNGVAFACSIIAARLLSREDFGRYMFVESLLVYTGLFFEFGLAMAAGRLMAVSHDEDERARLCGAWMVLFVPVAVAYAASIALSSLFVDQVFGLNVRRALLLCAVPGIGGPLQTALREVLQGRGSISLLAWLNTTPWVGLLAYLGCAWAFSITSVEMLAVAHSLSFLLTGVVIAYCLRPSLRDVRRHAVEVLQETRRFGTKAFLGRVLGTGTFQLDVPLIGYFTHSAGAVGLYRLAKAIAMPIPVLSRSLGTVWYVRFANSPRIPAPVLRANLLCITCVSLGLWLFARPIVAIFPKAHSAMLPLLYVWILTSAVQGVYQMLNLFLQARGHGSELRKLAALFAVANLVLNFALIPTMGAMGACLASLGACLLWLAPCIVFYRRAAAPEKEGV